MARYSALASSSIASLALSLAVSCGIVARDARAQDDDAANTAKLERTAEIEPAKDKAAAERIIAEIGSGSIELSVDPGADRTRVEAEFVVDGRDDKDVKRRSELVKLYATRAADQTVVVQPMFPGKPMRRDSARIRIIVPRCAEASLKSTSGALTALGTAGKLRLNAKSGALKVERHTGSIDAVTGDGTIDITGATAEVRASAGAGGDVKVALADGNDLPFDIEARTGSVRIEVAKDFDGTVKMHTTSGDLDLSDPGKRTRTPQTSEHTRTIEVGAPGGQSEVRTTTGSVKLVVRAK